jgi:hypothetical protein
MSFELKNIWATYQKAMVTLFHDMMHKKIKVYMDDMIVKSKRGENHCQNLRKLFERLRRYRLKLNPIKCLFEVKSRKLLGFMVSSQGIEVDPDKVKTIQAMPAPKIEKKKLEVLGFFELQCSVNISNYSNLQVNLPTPSKEKPLDMERGMPRKF